MSNSILLAFLFIICVSCSEEDPLCPKLDLEQGSITIQDEYAIVETILRTQFRDKKFIHTSQKSLGLKSDAKYPEFLTDTKITFDTTDFQEYLALNAETFIWGDSFDNAAELINKDEINCHFDVEKDGWAGYKKKYENSEGFVAFARPFINEEGEAFLEYEFYCDWLCGYGYIASLKKEGNFWVLNEYWNTWIS